MYRRLKKTDLSAPLSRTEQFSIMVVAALEHLELDVCCPDCCPRCAVLANLLVTGELDAAVSNAPSEMLEDRQWWRAARVYRTWLYGRWEPTEHPCPKAEPVLVKRTSGACKMHRQQRKRCTCRQVNLAAFLAA